MNCIILCFLQFPPFVRILCLLPFLFAVPHCVSIRWKISRTLFQRIWSYVYIYIYPWTCYGGRKIDLGFPNFQRLCEALRLVSRWPCSRSSQCSFAALWLPSVRHFHRFPFVSPLDFAGDTYRKSSASAVSGSHKVIPFSAESTKTEVSLVARSFTQFTFGK